MKLDTTREECIKIKGLIQIRGKGFVGGGSKVIIHNGVEKSKGTLMLRRQQGNSGPE